MAYTKHNYKSGEKLYASQLNEMDDQIAKNESDVNRLTEEIAEIKEGGAGGSGGSGLPEDASAHQMLVTDAEGMAKWEDRTHYDTIKSIITETTVHTSANEQYGGLFTASIPAFELPTGNVVVVFNGVEYESVVSNIGIGNMSLAGAPIPSTGEPFFIGGIIGLVFTAEEMDVVFSVYAKELVQLDTKFLRNDVPRYGTLGELTRIEWDGTVDGLDEIVVNSFTYYKVSDLVIPFEHIQRAISKLSSGDAINEFLLGTNCYELRDAYVVLTPGQCVTERGFTFTANYPGIYFLKHEYATGLAWTEYVEIDTRRECGILYLTNPSGVKYAITVDDSGTLTATELT